MSEKVKCDICTDKGHCPEYAPGAFCVKERKPVNDLVNVVIGKRAKWIPSEKHIWQKDEDGEIDLWARASDFHNGPVCRVCWESPCVHCRPDWQSIPCTEKHSECSVCGEPQIEESNYCPNCGAKMDMEENRNDKNIKLD